MQSESTSIPPTKPPRRQAPRHPFDRRTSNAKRYAALVREFSDELGGEKRLSEGTMATVRQLASVIIQAEGMQAAIVRGEAVDAEQLVRVANLQSRLQRQLGAGLVKEQPDKPTTLADYLKAREQA